MFDHDGHRFPCDPMCGDLSTYTRKVEIEGSGDFNYREEYSLVDNSRGRISLVAQHKYLKGHALTIKQI